MSSTSKIEWTDASWTPIRARNILTGKVGWYCEHATTGCVFCYAEGMNKRLGTGLPFKPGHRKDVELFLDEEMLLAPLRWKKPRMIFVCSMTDLFADFVPDEWIDKVFAVMALAPQHTFQVLTKRAERMRAYFGDAAHAVPRSLRVMVTALEREVPAFQIPWSLEEPRYASAKARIEPMFATWPLPNVWLGVSTERQQEADERIPHLLATPAAVRFISAEPLLGPIYLNRIKVEGHGWQDVLNGWRDCKDYPGRENRLDWVIVGGESGAGARPMHPDWARSLRDECAAAGVKFFFKQWGEHAPLSFDDLASEQIESDELEGKVVGSDNQPMHRVGKKAAGRTLDGREHNDMPGRAA